MKMVNIHEAKTNLSALLADVESKDEHIIICRSGKPIAKITPIETNKGNRLLVKEELKPLYVKGDLTEPSSEDWDV